MGIFSVLNENVNAKFSFDNVKSEKYNLAIGESFGVKDLIQNYLNESKILRAELTSDLVLSKLDSKFGIRENTVLEAKKVFIESMNELNSIFMANIRNCVSEAKEGIDKMVDDVNEVTEIERDKVIQNEYEMSCKCNCDNITESMNRISHSFNFVMDTKFLNKGIFESALVESMTDKKNADLNSHIMDKLKTISEAVTVEAIKEMYNDEKVTMVNESSFGDMVTVGRVLDTIMENFREQSDALAVLEAKLENEVFDACNIANTILESNNFNTYAINTFNGLNETVVRTTLEHVSNVLTSVEENSSNLIKLIKE